MLGCIQPISSPMMNRILGFLSCAWADATALTASPRASVSSISFCIRFMVLFLFGFPTRRASALRSSWLLSVGFVALIFPFPEKVSFAREFANSIGTGYGLQRLLQIHKRHRVLRIHEVRNLIAGGPPGDSLDAREVHDRFVELYEHRLQGGKPPAVVHPRILARRVLWHARRDSTIESHVVFLERIHSKVVHRTDGAQLILRAEPRILRGEVVFPSDVDIRVVGIATDVRPHRSHRLTIDVNP